MRPWRLAAFLLPLLCALLDGASAARAAGPRSVGLQKAWEAPEARRSVFFIRGMTCRACTMLIDRNLIREEGVYWLRFNYPLRLMVLYHDPRIFPGQRFIDFMAQTGEMTAELMKSGPAGEGRTEEGGAVAVWKGGSLSLEEARTSSRPFEETLKAAMIERGTGEWDQVAYEIAGEAVRDSVLLDLARRAGYGSGDAPVELPMVVAKDFYWPVELLPLTGDERAVANYLIREVTGGEENEKGRERFDDWLRGLWEELALDFRGEVLELPR